MAQTTEFSQSLIDAATLTLRLGDSYIKLEPIAPEAITKALSYWHKSFSRDPEGYSMVVSGETVRLYTLVVNQVLHRGDLVNHTTLVSLPGFAHKLRVKLADLGYTVNVIDERIPTPEPDIVAACRGLRDYQYECLHAALHSRGGVISAPTGFGKCTAPATKVLYADGTVKTMGEVKVGDQLMGDDSTPRTVLERIDGYGPMYRITPKNGDVLEVADHHILSLVKSGDCGKYPDGHTVAITITDYLAQSDWFKWQYKLHKVAVDFPTTTVTVDPYFMGLWLGDGTWCQPRVTSTDQEVIEFLAGYAKSLGLRHVVNSRITHGLVGRGGRNYTNPLTKAMRAYGLMQSKVKRLPREYLVNSREVRLQTLAGLLDSDGSLRAHTVFDFSMTNKDLVNDAAFLARSLGFRVHSVERGGFGFGKHVKVFRLTISGDTHLIPTRIARKQATVRRQKKEPLRTGFTVERVADGPYVGVRLDGNQLHVLGDMTVTHNTHIIGALVRGFPKEGLKLRGTPKVLVVTPTLDISRKNYNDLIEILPEREIGLVNTTSKVFSDDVQVITPESLEHVDLKDVGLLIYDEVHTLSLNRMTALLDATHAIKYGMSATPSGRFDGGDLVIEGLFGPVVYSKSYGDAVKDGAIVPIKVYWVESPRPPQFHGYTTKNGCYRNAVWRNRDMHAVVATILGQVAPDVQALCVVDKLEHMNFLCPYLPDVTMVHAETAAKALTSNRHSNLHAISRKDRKRIYDQVADGTIKRILSTGVYRAGVNFPDLQVLLNCEGMGSQIIAGQLPGRASRATEEKNMGYIVDFHHPWDMVEKHGRQTPGMLLRDDRSREQVYTSLGFDQEWVTDISTMTFR